MDQKLKVILNHEASFSLGRVTQIWLGFMWLDRKLMVIIFLMTFKIPFAEIQKCD